MKNLIIFIRYLKQPHGKVIRYRLSKTERWWLCIFAFYQTPSIYETSPLFLTYHIKITRVSGIATELQSWHKACDMGCIQRQRPEFPGEKRVHSSVGWRNSTWEWMLINAYYFFSTEIWRRTFRQMILRESDWLQL